VGGRKEAASSPESYFRRAGVMKEGDVRGVWRAVVPAGMHEEHVNFEVMATDAYSVGELLLSFPRPPLSCRPRLCLLSRHLFIARARSSCAYRAFLLYY
jgi:hypothetical protein